MSVTYKILKILSVCKKPFWKSFGFKSVIKRPLMISGKKRISIGKNVIIRDFCRMECIGCWNNSILESSIEIGDNTVIEQSSHIISAGKLTIGNNCLISARFYVSTCNHSYEIIDYPIIKQPLIVKDVYIGDNCFIGMDVKVFPGCHIGNNVIIGANSIVMEDIPPYSVVVGIPAKVIKKYDFIQRKWVRIKEIE